jgi:hypothetical protein
MITITIEYEDVHVGINEKPTFDDIALRELSESCEAIVGLVFAEELDRVDVRLRPFGPYDQYDEPLFITIDIEEKEMVLNPELTCEQFITHFSTHINACLNDKLPFRVWVRRISGSFAETVNH